MPSSGIHIVHLPFNFNLLDGMSRIQAVIKSWEMVPTDRTGAVS
jgi:hypothetical protein